MQQLVLVEHHLLARGTDHIVHMGQLNRIDRTRLFAHPAEDATEFIDLELGGVFLAIVPRRLRRLDMDAVGRADRGAHHARYALDPARGISIEPMHAPEV